MKKAAILAMAVLLNAQNITELLNAIDKTADSRLDEIMIKETKINKNIISYSMYPKISLFANYVHYNEDMSVMPITPTESSKLIRTNSSIPFSQNIARVGIDISFPLFIKSIYDNKKKMSYLLNATTYMAKINRLKREASLISAVSNLNYLFRLKDALNKEADSIQTSIDAIKVGVEVGRIPEFKLLRLKDAKNQLKIKIEDINANIAKMQSLIYKLTKIKIDSIIPINSYSFKKGEFISVKPLKEQLKASNYDIKSKKDAFLPKITFKINANRAFAKAYNTGDQIALNSANAGIYISWDIFNKKNSGEIQKSKILQTKTNLQIQKTIKDLTAEIDSINRQLKTIKKSIILTKNSISLKEELLKGAKVAFKLDRMNVDEYLKYEDDLALAKAKLANLIAQKNSLIAQKAFIYGKNLKKVFK